MSRYQTMEDTQGRVKVDWMDTSCDDRYYCPELYLKWTDDFGEQLNILFMTKGSAEKIVRQIQEKIKEIEEHEERIQHVIKNTAFGSLYNEFEHKYNPYPVQMSRCEAFSKALRDGLIDEDVYEAAHRYYKNLWCYVGD